VDCEKFDRVVLDLLYEELDELTNAAARRHMEHCTRCRRIAAGLRATREVGTLPIVEPPDSLEARILELEQRARADLPWRKRLGRTVSILASYAMRPQLAMAAVALLMIGSSLIFLRATPGDRKSVTITERGVPENESAADSVIAVPEKSAASDTRLAEPAHGAVTKGTRERRAEAEPPTELASPSGGSGVAAAPAAEASEPTDSFSAGVAALRAGRAAEAQREFEAVEASGGPNAAAAALKAAEAAKLASGCGVAAERFEQVSARHASVPEVAELATWQAAECYRILGQLENARRNYEALLQSPTYEQRAQAALDSLGHSPAEIAARKSSAAAGAARPARTAPRPAAKPAPAATSTGP
jgi:hypothetical protein